VRVRDAVTTAGGGCGGKGLGAAGYTRGKPPVWWRRRPRLQAHPVHRASTAIQSKRGGTRGFHARSSRAHMGTHTRGQGSTCSEGTARCSTAHTHARTHTGQHRHRTQAPHTQHAAHSKRAHHGTAHSTERHSTTGTHKHSTHRLHPGNPWPNQRCSAQRTQPRARTPPASQPPTRPWWPAPSPPAEARGCSGWPPHRLAAAAACSQGLGSRKRGTWVGGLSWQQHTPCNPSWARVCPKAPPNRKHSLTSRKTSAFVRARHQRTRAANDR
jgi:hypothetical protein